MYIPITVSPVRLTGKLLFFASRLQCLPATITIIVRYYYYVCIWNPELRELETTKIVQNIPFHKQRRCLSSLELKR